MDSNNKNTQAQTPSPTVVPPASPIPSPGDKADRWLAPVNRSGLAIAAGYLAFLALLIIPAPIPLIVGILALRDLKKHPNLWGKGRTWFGIILGGLGTLVLIYFIFTA